jgi:hypothetical protein
VRLPEPDQPDQRTEWLDPAKKPRIVMAPLADIGLA